jgi:hypothetical protein
MRRWCDEKEKSIDAVGEVKGKVTGSELGFLKTSGFEK